MRPRSPFCKGGLKGDFTGHESLIAEGMIMEFQIGKSTLAIVEGDITKEETDAIVNAANSGLRGGGGVDGAIHRAGGPVIMEECRKIGHCPTGQAVITTGGNLKARHVIHTVGPVYSNGNRNEAGLLKSAYLESLKLASKKGLKSVSFPAISTGAYGYPLNEAAHIALQTAIDYLKEHQEIERVRFVLFGKSTYGVFAEELQKLSAQ
jgi:O-acetyl-ADP-ribose deacetylase (regulator of RNase III)